MHPRDHRGVDDEIGAGGAADRLDLAGKDTEREWQLGVAVRLEIQMVTAASRLRHELAHAGVDDLAAARQQRLARDLVLRIDRQRRLAAPSLPSRCMRNVVMFFEYIWLA